MTEYSIEFRPEAIADLERLDQVIAQRILSKIRWLAENFDNITPKPLAWEVKSLFKLRVGDYGAIYSVSQEERIITIHLIGHRREIYR